MRVIDGRITTDRPLIVEGVCLCRVLKAIDRLPDFLVWVENKGGPLRSPNEVTRDYVCELQPDKKAHFPLVWDGPDLV